MMLTKRIRKLEDQGNGLRVILRRNLRAELKARPRRKGQHIVVLPDDAEKL